MDRWFRRLEYVGILGYAMVDECHFSQLLIHKSCMIGLPSIYK